MDLNENPAGKKAYHVQTGGLSISAKCLLWCINQKKMTGLKNKLVVMERCGYNRGFLLMVTINENYFKLDNKVYNSSHFLKSCVFSPAPTTVNCA